MTVSPTSLRAALVVCALVSLGVHAEGVAKSPSEKPGPILLHLERDQCPVRLGGVFLWGLGDHSNALYDSATNSEKLSKSNRQWIAENCDVTAIPSVCLSTADYPWIVTKYPAFTGLIYLYASCLYSKPRFGSAGTYTPSMAKFTLRTSDGREVPYPDANGHWMDFGSRRWATYWKQEAASQCAKFGAQGTVVAELPVNNTFVQIPKQYAKFNERADATTRWLEAAHDPMRTLLVPAALDFERPADTAPLPPAIMEPHLQGTLWDEYYPLIDGAWLEGFVRPYWNDEPLNSRQWEIQLEAMDRYAEAGQVFIAMAAYKNANELESDLASYLLVVHHQGRAVFQPMPLTIKGHPDAGYSLTIMREQVKLYPGYFNVPLGRPVQTRHMVPDGKLNVWVRKFQHGVVYFNSADSGSLTVNLGAPMRRMNGSLTRRVLLPPMTGAVLLYSSGPLAAE